MEPKAKLSRQSEKSTFENVKMQLSQVAVANSLTFNQEETDGLPIRYMSSKIPIIPSYLRSTAASRAHSPTKLMSVGSSQTIDLQTLPSVKPERSHSGSKRGPSK